MTTRTSALKRLLSGLMALCLVLSLMPMMPLELTAEAADTTKTVYVGVIEYITDFVPTLHYWGSGFNGNATLTATGETVQFSVGSSYWDNAAQNFRVYKAEVPVDATGAKTWDEGSNGKWASEDVTLSGDDLILLFEWGGTYHNQNASYDPVEPVSVTVYCINSNKWAEVAAYAWNEGGAGTSWPGIKMSKTGQSVNGFDVYEVTFDVAYENVIFNNNGNGSQTENLSLNEGQYYDTKSGTWYASLDEVPVIDPLATDRYLVGEFNSWSTIANEFKLDAEGSATGYISLELNANTRYEFKIVREGTWTSCATPITGTVAGLTFSSSVGDNCVITTADAGVYVFSFGVDNSMLSVTYPGCNHAEQEVIPGYDADCDTSGLTDGMKCSVCGEILVKQEEIPASGHTEGKVVVENEVAADCDTDGSYDNVVYCTVCGEELSRQTVTVDALGHSYDEITHECICGKKEPITVTISVPKTDSSNAYTEEVTFDYGTSVSLSLPAAWEGYTFVGYADAEGNIVAGRPNFEYTFTENTTLYAVYEKNVTYYDIWIQGVQVTDQNASDILGDLDEGATVIYDADTNTLTLNNASLIGALMSGATEEGTIRAIFTQNSGLNLKLVGENTITVSDPDSVYIYAIEVDGDLNIDGDGSLCVTTAGAVSWNVGITCDDLLVKGGNVEVHAGAANVSAGVLLDGGATVESGAVLTASGNPDGMYFGIGIEGYDPIINHGTINAITSEIWEDLGGVRVVFFGESVLAENSPGNAISYVFTEGSVVTVEEGVVLTMFYVTADNFVFDGTVVNNGTVILPDFYTYATIPTGLTGGKVTIREASYTWNGSKYVCVTHTEETIPGYDADCDTPGLTDGMKCSVCGEILVKQEEIPASGHAKPVYTNNGETHSVDYPCCDALDSAAEDHDFANEAHKCACGKVETFTVSWYNNGKLTEQTYEFGATVEGFIPEREYINSEMFRGWNDFRCWKDMETSDVITLPFTMPAHSVEIYASTAFTGWVGGPDKIAYYYAVKDVEQSGWLCVNDENELVTDGNGTWYYAGTDFQIVTDVTEIEGVLYAFDHSTGAFLNDYTGVYETNDGDLCYVENGIVIPAKLHQASISLNGNIAINYYMLLSDKVLSDENAYMQFTMADGEVITVPVSQGVAHDGYYVFSCEVAAKEMTDDVVCQFFYTDGCTEEFTYNVKAYTDDVLDVPCSDNVKALMEAMLNYGAASQIHFGYNTDKLANGGNNPDYTDVVIEGYGAVAGQGTKLATLYSASLILKSETTLRFFFRVDSSVENFTATHDGKTLEVKQRGGFYYVDVVGIAAKDLDEDVTITISDGTESAEVFFNPMAYCQGVQNDDTGTYTQEMKDLVAAIYLYNQAANNYFKER